MDFLQLVAVIGMVLGTYILFLKPRRTAKLPPGPYPFPIIGNLLHLGQAPHRSLTKLSKTYGPLMSLHLGTVYTVVVTSAAVAKEILTKHDLAVSSRAVPAAGHALDLHKHSITFLPAGTKWRRLRKLGKEHLFSMARLEASQELRLEKVGELREYVRKCCDAGRVVEVTEAGFVTALNLIGGTLCSIKIADYGTDAAHEIKSFIDGVTSSLGDLNIADFFPVLQCIDPQGIKKRAEFEIGRMIAFLENVINQRLRSREESSDSPKISDFLETLLDLANGTEYNYTVRDIACILQDFFVAASDTTAITTEWAMRELLVNPEKLSKAKAELRTVIGEDNQVKESDFSKLPYFQAVIKEVLRLHAPVPFLVPRKSEEDVQVNGYTIPKGTHLLLNVWAIGRDPNTWSNPDSFEPERFLDNKIDFKGQDFELIPFGAGRRMCPGLPLANRMAPMIVATLIHNFDWKLHSRLKPGEVENEKFGKTLHNAVPLLATPYKIA